MAICQDDYVAAASSRDLKRIIWCRLLYGLICNEFPCFEFIFFGHWLLFVICDL